MNTSVTYQEPKQFLAKGSWLLIFCFAYGFIFFPGALFYKPVVIEQENLFQATELFLVFPKLLFFGILTLLGFLECRPTINFKHPLVRVVSVYFLFVVISSLMSNDQLTYILLGARGRFDGLIYQSFLCLFIVSAWQTLKNFPDLPKRLIFWLLLGGFIQAVIYMGQYFGFDPLTIARRWQPLETPVGLLAHPGFVAGLLMPLLLIATVQIDSFKNTKWFFYMFLFVNAVTISIISNRTALLACVLGLMGILLVRRTLQSLVLTGVVLLTLFYARDVLPQPNALRDLQDSTTTKTRLMMWNLTLKLLPEIAGAPWIGGGSDALRLAQLRNPPVEDLTNLTRLELGWTDKTVLKKVEVIPGAGETERDQMLRFDFVQLEGKPARFIDLEFSWDKAHNFWLDRLVAYGIFSVFIWLFIYLYPIYWSWRFGSQANIIWTWVTLGILFYYLTWFPVMQVEPIHVVVALMAWVGIERAKASPDRAEPLEETALAS
jgi:hypothetical protein